MPSSVDKIRINENSAPVLNHINHKPLRSRCYFFTKLAQTILITPIVDATILSFRCVKLLTWAPVKAGCYKVSGYHSESAAYLEKTYLETAKALRDIIFIPSVARRAFKDMVGSRQPIVDDIGRKSADDYLKVKHHRSLQHYSSYLHGVANFEVISPEGITEFPATTDGALQTVMASHIFKPDMMAINFGNPNVAAFVTEAKEDGSVQTVKVDAKSLYREPMKFHGTNGKIQSGVFLVPTNLPLEALARFKAAAAKLQDRKDLTCVNTNCRVLEEAGFSIENVALNEVVFPNTFMDHLLFRNVFYTDSKGVKHKVHFDILNTTSDRLEKYFEKVDTAVLGTRYRHSRRNADTEEDRKTRGVAAQALIQQEKDILKAQEAQGKEPNLGAQRKITVSVPSFIGGVIGKIWGRHTIYEVDLADKKAAITEAFQALANKGRDGVKLRPFPQEKPNLATRLKRDFFFSGPMIRLLRRHIMGRKDEIYLNPRGIFEHLKSIKGERLNYVILDDKVVLSKIQANGNTSEAHRKAADWALSKHALIANRQVVFCSGELWYDEAKDRYMMNADSGTYKPSQEHVEVAAKLANEIFGRRFEAAPAVERAA